MRALLSAPVPLAPPRRRRRAARRRALAGSTRRAAEERRRCRGGAPGTRRRPRCAGAPPGRTRRPETPRGRSRLVAVEAEAVARAERLEPHARRGCHARAHVGVPAVELGAQRRDRAEPLEELVARDPRAREPPALRLGRRERVDDDKVVAVEVAAHALGLARHDDARGRRQQRIRDQLLEHLAQPARLVDAVDHDEERAVRERALEQGRVRRERLVVVEVLAEREFPGPCAARRVWRIHAASRCLTRSSTGTSRTPRSAGGASAARSVARAQCTSSCCAAHDLPAPGSPTMSTGIASCFRRALGTGSASTRCSASCRALSTRPKRASATPRSGSPVSRRGSRGRAGRAWTRPSPRSARRPCRRAAGARPRRRRGLTP